MLLFVIVPIGLLLCGIGLWLTSCKHFYVQENEYTLEKNNDVKGLRKYRLGHSVNRSDYHWAFNGFGIAILSIALVAILILGITGSNLRVIDNKIALYEEENTRIEASVSQMVDNYISHEQTIISDVSENISPTLVFSMYPELKSNTLVEKEIENYVNNQTKLRELKESRYDYELYLWWVYFG